jgi:hypothetical protein
MRSLGLRSVADNLWVLEFPAKMMGTAIGRRATILRLANGEILVHSTAPFSADDVAAISALGPVAWLLDASCFHDTFAEEGTAAFPQARFFAPPGFSGPKGRKVESLTGSLPEAWAADLAVEPIAGMPRVNECAVLHRPSRTLIVADLVFNMRTEQDRWTTFFFRYLAGTFGRVGMSRMFRLFIQDRPACERSIARVLAWDFDRLITGHGEIVETGGQQELREAVTSALGRSHE